MTKAIIITVVCLCAIAAPAPAQTLGDAVISQFAVFKKSKAAVRVCVNEEGRMQVERNQHYDALLHALAKDPGFPTIDEMSRAQAQVRLEDEALGQKRDECTPLFDELVTATKELQRNCEAYTALKTSEEATPATNALAIEICRGSTKRDDGDKADNQ
jgi:hypothetical protein